MIRIHTSDYVPKYRYGQWSWNERDESFDFESRNEMVSSKEEFIMTNGYKFQLNMNQIEEIIFRQEYQRSDSTHDADVVLVQDIKNLVMFLAPSEMIYKEFLNFMNNQGVHKFLQALIIYFEYFLKMVEFVLVRRDEINCDDAQIQSDESTEIKRIFSDHLSQYRLVLAREYSTILLGFGEMAPFYHLRPIVNISQSIKDKKFHEHFLAVCTQIVWISMHRRAYDVIEMEMCRLFRSEHFKLTRNEKLQYSLVEASMLYGKNYKRVNYRTQNSPLIQEISNVSTVNLPILWIGQRKYRGTDLRIHQVELEYIVPDSQLSFIDITHGILGHPNKIYNTLLSIVWEAVRLQNYSESYDPYRIIRQPGLHIPSIDEDKIRKQCKKYEMYYNVISHEERWTVANKRHWYARDKVVNFFKTEGLTTSIWSKCEIDVRDPSYGPSVKEIIDKFVARKHKLRKN